MELKVVSWNMRHTKDAWYYLVNELNPDVALLQESPEIPKDIDENLIIRHIAKQNWGNAIYVKNLKQKEVEIETKYEGSLLVSAVNLNDGSRIFFINIYGIIERAPDKKFGLVNAGTHRMLSDLAFLLMGKTRYMKNYTEKRFIMSGDFNMDRRMDDNPTIRFVKKGQRTTNIVFDRVLDFGFYDCLKKSYPDFVQTYRHYRNKENYPWQIDHMFATKKEYDSLKKIEVMLNHEIEKISDHNPIVAEFEFN